MKRHTYRAPDPMLTMTVHLPDEAVERGRQRCHSCRCPLVRATIRGRQVLLNPDGSPHRGTCRASRIRESLRSQRYVRKDPPGERDG